MHNSSDSESGTSDSDSREIGNNSDNESSITLFIQALNYGIRFSDEEYESVISALKTLGDPYSQLVVSKHTKVGHSSGESSIYMDNLLGRSLEYIIYCPDMSIYSDDFEEPECIYMHFEPSDLVKQERRYEPAVNILTDLHSNIIAYFRLRKLKTKNLYLGWSSNIDIMSHS